MIIGILADSHDNLPKLKKAVALFNKKNICFVAHAGDYIAPFALGMLEKHLRCEYRGVYGNNDGERRGLEGLSKGKVQSETRVSIKLFHMISRFLIWIKRFSRRPVQNRAVDLKLKILQRNTCRIGDDQRMSANLDKNILGRQTTIQDACRARTPAITTIADHAKRFLCFGL